MGSNDLAEGQTEEKSEVTGEARRLALLVEYEGTNYAGFQLQADEPTIQGEIERALFAFLGEQIRIRGASRTDSGAHALGQVIDFTTDSRYSAETFVGALNYHLPEDIRVTRARDVANSFNSRRDAVSRVYRYRILNRPIPSPLSRRHCHWIRDPLQIEKMSQAARHLIGTHDFRPLAPGHPADRSAVRTVYRWEVSQEQDSEDTIAVICEANGFMLHQIRRTNAVLAEVGKGRWPPESVLQILGETGRKLESVLTSNIPSLPARGLCLVEVKYRDQLWKVEQHHETN
ncbi:MAG: tRNA pseudouridine(38-40) synthase TruA [Chloroflexi bacterium]|nr:tRNA pseudouridine(38-40) synthase TruA [Chloroflexota bacterium]